MTTVRSLLEESSGLTRAELLALVRARINPNATFGQVDGELELLEGEISEVDGLISVRRTDPREEPSREAIEGGHPRTREGSTEAGDLTRGRREAKLARAPASDRPAARHLIAIDLETVLRYTATHPKGERTIFQVGARRFGPDAEWNAAAPVFNHYIHLEPELAGRIVNPELREQVEVLGEAAETVLGDLLDYVDEADALVAYNGRAFDFPLIDDAMRTKLGSAIPARIRRIDGLYVALAVWPVPPRRHALSRLINDDRFGEIRERLQIDLTGLVAHDAADDTAMLAELMRFAATELSDWPADLQALARSVGARSDAWRMLFDLADIATPPRAFDATEVRATMSAALATSGKSPVRLAAPARGAIDISALAPGGSVDIDILVRAAKDNPEASARPAQRDMVSRMRDWVAAGTSALVEAPTGTGKSYAILAVALDWLAAHPANRVVISTFTRQLQSQLAHDIYAIHQSGLAPGLIELTSLVKGSLNRLSLAGLVRALADGTDGGKRRRGDFVSDPAFAELCLYLALRFVAVGTPVEEWESRSVDPVDIEPFFERYLATRPDGPSREGLFLRFLSQAESRDYDAGTDLAEHTSLVREVLARNRLLVTNHALLLAHLDDFPAAERTLLIVDEAHSLEAAATNALEATVEYAVVEESVAELHEWMRPLAPGASDEDVARHARTEKGLRDLEWFLDNETVPNGARRVLDTVSRDPLHPGALRTTTLASPVTRPVPPRAGFIRSLEELGRRTDELARALHGEPARSDRLEDERRRALADRLDGLSGAITTVITDLLAIIEPVDPTAPPPNRVVWMSEGAARGMAPRDFRFGVTSSPIELAREPSYARLTGAFSRLYYLSATLRVDGAFTFIRERLALPADRVDEICLPTPFDIEHQAKLVVFSDFPSWAEQESAAISSVARQVGGFLREVAVGNRNGAMVLTTSRDAAALIYERMIGVRGEQGGDYPISSANYLGTQTAVGVFRERGGALVGTKGLWQGVDVESPERLRMVWINKLPFAPFADPVVVARREVVRLAAEAAGIADPDGYAAEHYYLPLAAMELRQAVGRLVRSADHRGIVVISDRKLAGPTRLHRRYRQVFLGSLEGLAHDDVAFGPGGGNLRTMADGWREIWQFFAQDPSVLSPERAAELCTAEALETHTLLPATREIRRAALSEADLTELAAAGGTALVDTILERCTTVASNLRAEPTELREYQREAIAALAGGRDVMAILPTSHGKSFIFQLPALALPGVTVVVSPLVSLMTDQALALNRSVGGMVRALVAPMRESNSRTGKAEVADALTNPDSTTGIKVIYVSPERLCQLQFQRWIETGVERGIVRRIAIDEAHTFAMWGDDFRPSFKRAERLLDRLRAHPRRPRLMALTATATPTVRERLRRAIFGLDARDESVVAEVARNPIRPELALYRRTLGKGEAGPITKQELIEALIDSVSGHTIVYTLTRKEAKAIHAALIEHLGDGERGRVRLYHGAMTSSEKESVAHDFSAAPSEGEDDFRPMIVVATAAFGLGVDRRDIRTVLVASPPADLAGLYQEIGRGGRDGRPATGIMLGTPRAFRTLAFMEGLRKVLDPLRVATIAGPILGGTGPLDMDALAFDLLAADVAAGAVPQDVAEKPETLGEYRTAIVRVYAALAADGLLEDRGDFPDVVAAVVRDDAPTPDAELAEFLAGIAAATHDPKAVDVCNLAAALGAPFPDEAADPGDLWVRLLELHSLGYLDVSQVPTKRYLTSLVRTGGALPAKFADRFISLAATAERLRLVDFFSPSPTPTCVNDNFRAYFEAGELPDGTCATPEVRCSGCWRAGHGAEGERRPAILSVLTDARPRTKLADRTAGEFRGIQARIARNVERLLRARWRGLSWFQIEKTLRGEDHFYSKHLGAMQRLWPELVNSSGFGSMPGLRRPDLVATLEAMVAAGRLAKQTDPYEVYRYGDHLRAEEARAARLAADADAAAEATAPAPTVQTVGEESEAPGKPEAPGAGEGNPAPGEAAAAVAEMKNLIVLASNPDAGASRDSQADTAIDEGATR